MDSSVSAKDEIWFLRVCHHISNAVYQRRGPHRSSAIIFGLARNRHRFLSSVCVLVTILTELFRLLSVYYYLILISQHHPSENYSCILYIIYKEIFRTSQKTECASVSRISRCLLYQAHEHINRPDGKYSILHPSILLLDSPSLQYNGYMLVSGGSVRRVAFITHLVLPPKL
jgi:hypothetical protein